MNADRRSRLFLLVGAAAGLALAGIGSLAPGEASRAPTRGEFARVNGVGLANAELARALTRVAADTDSAESDALRDRVRERLIDEELLVQRGTALGFPGSDPNVRKALVSALIGSIVAEASSGVPDDAELEAFLAENSGYFAAPVRARVVRIEFRDGPTADARIADALAALDTGTEAALVAAKYGDPAALELPDALLPVAKLHELLGPTLATAALALEAGARTPPLATEGGRVIVVSLGRESQSSRSLAELRPQVESEWRRRQGERALREYVESLRRGAEIRIAEDEAR